jgi:hypothetical protein
VAALLESPEIGRLIADLDATRRTGRPGYPIPTTVGAALVTSVYLCAAELDRTVRLIGEHAAFREAIGGAPSVDAARAVPPAAQSPQSSRGRLVPPLISCPKACPFCCAASETKPPTLSSPPVAGRCPPGMRRTGRRDWRRPVKTLAQSPERRPQG